MPVQPGKQRHSNGWEQNPFRHPGNTWQSLHVGPVQPNLHLHSPARSQYPGETKKTPLKIDWTKKYKKLTNHAKDGSPACKSLNWKKISFVHINFIKFHALTLLTEDTLVTWIARALKGHSTFAKLTSRQWNTSLTIFAIKTQLAPENRLPKTVKNLEIWKYAFLSSSLWLKLWINWTTCPFHFKKPFKVMESLHI